MTINWNNKTEVLVLVKQTGSALKFASKELRNDKEVVLESVRKNGVVLHWASEELRNNKEVVLAAVKQNKEALTFVSEELQNKIKAISPDNPEEGLRILIEIESLSQGKRIKKEKRGLKL